MVRRDPLMSQGLLIAQDLLITQGLQGLQDPQDPQDLQDLQGLQGLQGLQDPLMKLFRIQSHPKLPQVLRDPRDLPVPVLVKSD